MVTVRIIYISLFTANLFLVLKSNHIRKIVSEKEYRKHVLKAYKFHHYASIPLGLLLPFLAFIFKRELSFQTLSFAIVYIFNDFLMLELVDIESVVTRLLNLTLKNHKGERISVVKKT